MSKENNIVQKAREFAIKCHNDTNHKYDGQLYIVHLKMVVDEAIDFINLIDYNERNDVAAAAWLHDSIEDTRITYGDLKKQTNETIADLVYALTNEKGKTRKQRANDKYYKGIRNTPNATFIKLCDRIANVKYSKQKVSSMFKKYKQEHAEFKKALTKRNFIMTILLNLGWLIGLRSTNKYEKMWDHLDELFNN